MTEDFTAFHGFGFATGRVHLADGGADYSGLYVGINNSSAHLPTAAVGDAGTYSVFTTCGLSRVCLGPNYTSCVDVAVPYNDAGIAPMDLVY